MKLTNDVQIVRKLKLQDTLASDFQPEILDSSQKIQFSDNLNTIFELLEEK